MGDAMALLNALEADLDEATRAGEAEQQREKALEAALQMLTHRSDAAQRAAVDTALRKDLLEAKAQAAKRRRELLVAVVCAAATQIQELSAQEQETTAEIARLRAALSSVVTDFDERLFRETNIDTRTATDRDVTRQQDCSGDIQVHMTQIAIRHKELAALTRLHERYHKASEALRPMVHTLTAQLRKKLKENQNQEQLLRKLQKDPASTPPQRCQDERRMHQRQRFEALHDRQKDSKRAKAPTKAPIGVTALVPANRVHSHVGQPATFDPAKGQEIADSFHEEDFSLSD